MLRHVESRVIPISLDACGIKDTAGLIGMQKGQRDVTGTAGLGHANHVFGNGIRIGRSSLQSFRRGIRKRMFLIRFAMGISTAGKKSPVKKKSETCRGKPAFQMMFPSQIIFFVHCFLRILPHAENCRQDPQIAGVFRDGRV